MKNKINVAVILAGGNGNRFGADIPKQFVKVKGIKIIELSIKAFFINKNISELIIVSHSDWVEVIEDLVLGYSEKKITVLKGGVELYHSTLSAINFCRKNYDVLNVNLIIHDAVRPLISQRIINDCVSALLTYNCVEVGIKSTNTLFEVLGENHIIDNIVNRENYIQGQGPGCFYLPVLIGLYDKYLNTPDFDGFTSDAHALLKCYPKEKIYVVEGDASNFKITYKSDIKFLEFLLSSEK